MTRSPLLLLAAVGCIKPPGDLTALDFSEVPFENAYLTVDDAVVSAFDTDLTCPDGQPARVFAVYRTGTDANAPIAIVLHSGAFDYVTDPDVTGYLDGTHYQGTSRLSREWSIGKVAETLGMPGVDVDPSEENLGALPAALTEADFVQLYPGNCWGDLWHNEEGYQDGPASVEGFDRNGRTFAYWMVKAIFEPNFRGEQGIDLSGAGAIDANQIFYIGLGDGGRGVAELLSHPDVPKPAGLLVDSSPDLLSPYFDDPVLWADEITGITRIFGEDNIANIDAWSLAATPAASLPDRVGFVWSDVDPRQPLATAAATAEVLTAQPGAWVANTHEPTHVNLNRDPALAAAAVEYLLTGVVPSDEAPAAE